MSKDQSFHKWRWRFLFLWVVVFSVATSVSLSYSRNNSNDGKHARNAICALVADLGERIHSSEQFLIKHPNGVKGIATRTDIMNSLKNQKQTKTILEDQVHCK